MVSAAELERMMKLQDVILKAMAKRITWMAAAEIAGVSDRTMRRLKQRYEEFGYDGLSTSGAENAVSTGSRWRLPSRC